ncbi:thiolase family protein [Burkholderia sp. R-69980]|nr:thiolase family protein [Burkholderia sp. R-69980]
MEMLERKAAITGIGRSTIGRRLGRGGLDLTVDAILEALQNAGLDRSDIDGVACWPGQIATADGMSPTSIFEIRDALDLRLSWYSGGAEGPAQLTSILSACMAVATGQARHVVCFRTLTEATASAAHRTAPDRAGKAERIQGMLQWQIPYNAPSASVWTALFAQRYFHEYHVKREQLAQIALTSRHNAGLNPHAVYRKPLTMDDYLSSRMISTPLCLYDCDVPIDGSTAIIVSHVDAARDTRSVPIRIEAICGPLDVSTNWDQFPDLAHMACMAVGKRLWQRTDFRPKDVDCAHLYDGFSFFVLPWLEALGFCEKGEAPDFIEGGHRIALDGELPLNTDGGQLSAGRLHGFGHLYEAVTQLRGEAGARQTKNPKIAVVSNGGGPIASAALLVRD